MSMLETIGARAESQQQRGQTAPDLSKVVGWTDPKHDPAESTDARDRYYMAGDSPSGPVLLRVDFKLDKGKRVQSDAVTPSDYPGAAFASDADPETGKRVLAVPADAPAFDLSAGDPLPAFRVKRYALDGFARALVLGAFDRDPETVPADADPGE